jgi:hypothetical protein
MPPTSTVWLCTIELVVGSRATPELGELEVGANSQASVRAAFPGSFGTSGSSAPTNLLYVDVEIHHAASVAPSRLPSLSTKRWLSPKGALNSLITQQSYLALTAVHTLPISRLRPSPGMNRRNQKGTNPHRASFTSSDAGPGCHHTAAGAAGGRQRRRG